LVFLNRNSTNKPGARWGSQELIINYMASNCIKRNQKKEK